MPTPRQGYYLKDGTKVPSVTTIIGRFKDSGGLLFWAFKRGKEGAAKLYDQDVLDIGTAIHKMVELRTAEAPDEQILAELNTLPIELQAKATSSFDAYLAWSKNFSVQVIEREIQMVSEKHRFGGTADAIGLINNQLVLLDWKTSNAVYSDHIIQLAAYKALWEETFPERPITGGCHLLRFSKENGDFAHHFFADLSDEWEQFLDFRRCYERDKRISKRAA